MSAMALIDTQGRDQPVSRCALQQRMRACPMQCFARDYIENLVRVLLSTGKERWVLALQDRYHQLCAVNLPYFYLTLLTRTVAVSLGYVDLFKINAYTNCKMSRCFRRFQQIYYCCPWFHQ